MKRLVYSIISTVVLLFLGLYNYYSHPWIDVAACMEHPDLYDGSIVQQFHEPRIGELFEDGFMLQQKHGPSIRLYTDTTGLVRGKSVGIKARFHKQGYLEGIDVKMAGTRQYKIWLSVIPVIVLAVLFIRNFRFNFKHFYIEKKPHA